MKALQNAGTYELLIPEDTLRFFLEIIEIAARNCYQSESDEDDESNIEEKRNKFNPRRL